MVSVKDYNKETDKNENPDIETLITKAPVTTKTPIMRELITETSILKALTTTVIRKHDLLDCTFIFMLYLKRSYLNEQFTCFNQDVFTKRVLRSVFEILILR